MSPHPKCPVCKHSHPMGHGHIWDDEPDIAAPHKAAETGNALRAEKKLAKTVGVAALNNSSLPDTLNHAKENSQSLADAGRSVPETHSEQQIGGRGPAGLRDEERGRKSPDSKGADIGAEDFHSALPEKLPAPTSCSGTDGEDLRGLQGDVADRGIPVQKQNKGSPLNILQKVHEGPNTGSLSAEQGGLFSSEQNQTEVVRQDNSGREDGALHGLQSGLPAIRHGLRPQAGGGEVIQSFSGEDDRASQDNDGASEVRSGLRELSSRENSSTDERKKVVTLAVRSKPPFDDEARKVYQRDYMRDLKFAKPLGLTVKQWRQKFGGKDD